MAPSGERSGSLSGPEWSRSVVAAIKKVKGSAWLGKINGNGQRTLWEWDGSPLSIHGADFVLPCYDAELDGLLVQRYRSEYKGVEYDVLCIETILKRIEKLGGQLLEH